MNLTDCESVRTVSYMEKQPYTTPELIELGDVIEITQASLNGPYIDFQGSNPGGPVQTDNVI